MSCLQQGFWQFSILGLPTGLSGDTGLFRKFTVNTDSSRGFTGNMGLSLEVMGNLGLSPEVTGKVGMSPEVTGNMFDPGGVFDAYIVLVDCNPGGLQRVHIQSKPEAH